MDRTRLAEYVLARRFGAQRANEIAGDLLEQYTPARAHWEMVRLVLSMRGIDLVGLLLASLLFGMTSTALDSPWQLRFMAAQRSSHLGWSWDLSAVLAGISFVLWLGTTASALRLGTQHSITRTGLAYSVTLPILSALILQSELRWIAPVILVLVVLWRLRCSGLLTTLNLLLVAGAVMTNFWLLLHTFKLVELRTCLVHMHASAIQPTWLTFYSSCTPYAIHEWCIWFVGALVAYWLLSVLPVYISESAENIPNSSPIA